MIKVGDICIWQNINHPRYAYLNGTETMVVGPLQSFTGTNVATGNVVTRLGYLTDTLIPGYLRGHVALPHQLRKKFPDADDEDLVEDKELETT